MDVVELRHASPYLYETLRAALEYYSNHVGFGAAQRVVLTDALNRMKEVEKRDPSPKLTENELDTVRRDALALRAVNPYAAMLNEKLIHVHGKTTRADQMTKMVVTSGALTSVEIQMIKHHVSTFLSRRPELFEADLAFMKRYANAVWQSDRNARRTYEVMLDAKKNGDVVVAGPLPHPYPPPHPPPPPYSVDHPYKQEEHAQDDTKTQNNTYRLTAIILTIVMLLVLIVMIFLIIAAIRRRSSAPITTPTVVVAAPPPPP